MENIELCINIMYWIIINEQEHLSSYCLEIVLVVLALLNIYGLCRAFKHLGTARRRSYFYDNYYREMTFCIPYNRKKEYDILTNDTGNEAIIKSICVSVIGIATALIGYFTKTGELINIVDYIVPGSILMLIFTFFLLTYLTIKNENGLKILILKDMIEKDKMQENKEAEFKSH